MGNDDQLIQHALGEIWEVAIGLGLDPFEVEFELVPAAVMYEFGAYGLPSRFSHWTHGKAFQEMKTMYDYGLNKIYELVINADPCQAYLLEANSVVQNKMVIAHVIAHSDFFKNNIYFHSAPRDMLAGAAVNADRIRQYEFKYGRLEVERFLDAVLSIQEHVDPNQLIRQGIWTPRRTAPRHGQVHPQPYEDLFAPGELRAASTSLPRPAKIPESPEKDLLLFLLEHSEALQDWQRDVVAIVRAEMLYFMPQMRTKIINEGWASYWHARIMREIDLPVDESIEIARLHAAVLAPTGQHINPYLVGLQVLEDIERRWDNPTPEEREMLGRRPGQGKAKLFEIRETESDVSFLRNYLTRDLVRQLELRVGEQPDKQQEDQPPKQADWEEVRDLLVAELTNFGHPFLQVEDGNYEGKRELYIRHVFEGKELDLKYAERTMPYLYELWGKPVHIETVIDEKPHILTFEGGEEGLIKRAI